MSKKNRLLSAFEVRHISHTITEYVASIDGQAYFSRSWWLQIFLRHRLLFFFLPTLLIILTIMLRKQYDIMIGIFIIFCGALFSVLHNLAIEESVTIIHHFGIQLKRKYLLGREKIQFIEKERLHAVFIHEFIKGCEVRFGLAFELKQRSSSIQNSDNSTSILSSSAMKKSGSTSPPSSTLPHIPVSSPSNIEPKEPSISNSQAKATTLSVLFQEVYPGYEALKKVYRACAVETDIS